LADIVVNLRDGRPIWSLPSWAVEELRGAIPGDWSLYVEGSATEGAGDGGGVPSPGVLREVVGASVYLGFGIPAPVLEAGRETLEWVHSAAAGVGSSLHEAMLDSSVRFTNSAGIHGPPIAETVLGMLLYFARGLDFAVASQQRAKWDDAPFLEADTPVRELASMTVGILGYGGIGREVGRRARALGSEVLGLRRTPGRAEAGEAERDEAGVVVLHGEVGLTRLLKESDALVIAAPETPATRGILTAKRIRSLPRGALIVNVARGRLVDEDGLIGALRDGHLRGVGLDVFAVEPLPAEHPFWRLPNVLITPHTSPVTRGFWRREMDLILENLGRLLEGRSLRNEVDRERGY
jgi:phosphoglycerate dehydrogenase-like enzyme